MAIEDDVLVIGGGLAGTTAALAATERDGDVQVRLVSYKQSTLRHASGLIDVLGYTPAGDGPLVDPFDALEDSPTDTPLRARRARRSAMRSSSSTISRATPTTGPTPMRTRSSRPTAERSSRPPGIRSRPPPGSRATTATPCSSASRRCRTSKRRWRRPTSRRRASLRGPRRHGSVPRHRSRRRENHPVRAPARPRRIRGDDVR